MRYFMDTVSTDMEGSGSSFKFSVEDSATDEEVSDKGMQEAFHWISVSLDKQVALKYASWLYTERKSKMRTKILKEADRKEGENEALFGTELVYLHDVYSNTPIYKTGFYNAWLIWAANAVKLEVGDTYIETECDGILVLPELALRITEGAYRARNVPYSVMVSSTFYQRLKKQVEKKQNPSREALESFVQKLTQMTRIDRTDSVERVINKRASFENVGKQTLIDIAVIVNAYSGMLHRVTLDMISRIEEGRAVVPGQNIGVASNVNMDTQEALIREIEILFNKT